MTNPLGIRAIPGLLAEQNNALLDAFRQFPEIKTVVLYGSRAKGCHRPNSDIDLCIRDSTITLSCTSRASSTTASRGPSSTCSVPSFILAFRP